MFQPLAYVKPFRHRLMLRINEDQERFRIWNPYQRHWVVLNNETNTFATESLAITFSMRGSRADVHSHAGRTQNLFLADMCNNLVIGRMRLEETGRMLFFDDLAGVPVDRLADPWHHKIGAILGVPGHVSMNIRDVIAAEEDIFRYRSGEQKWFIPNSFRTPTASHDVDRAQTFTLAPETRQNRLANRLALIQMIHTPAERRPVEGMAETSGERSVYASAADLVAIGTDEATPATDRVETNAPADQHNVDEEGATGGADGN